MRTLNKFRLTSVVINNYGPSKKFIISLIKNQKRHIYCPYIAMKLLITFFISLSLFSQDISTIKQKTDRYSHKLSVEKLAKKINADFTSDENKAKAIFCWLTQNISYDLEEFYNPTNKKRSFKYRTIEEKNAILQGFKDEIVAETLKDNKAVCEGYAQTFAKVCNLLQIENAVIKGYVRASFNDIGKPRQQPNHSWNAVKLNNEWVYIDATWGAGHQINGKWLRKFKPYYFDIKKDTYFKSHFPEEDLWILKVGQIHKDDFYKQPIYSHRFLNTNYKLVQPTNGFLKKEKDGSIRISLKNIDATKKIHFGFLGEKYAKPAIISSNNGVTTASIIPPKNASQTFLMVDLEVILYFKLL